MSSEADTRANHIDPALANAGWKSSQIIREYYFTDGRKLSGNQRGSRCFVDYLLHDQNRHLAIIEAKKASAHPTQGLQQAIAYATKDLSRNNCLILMVLLSWQHGRCEHSEETV